MKADITDYIMKCETCQRIKGLKSKDILKAPLRQLGITEKFNERVHADLMGPFKSNTENKYVLVMSDSFTKWIEIILIPDNKAETVCNAIYNDGFAKTR